MERQEEGRGNKRGQRERGTEGLEKEKARRREWNREAGRQRKKRRRERERQRERKRAAAFKSGRRRSRLDSRATPPPSGGVGRRARCRRPLGIRRMHVSSRWSHYSEKRLAFSIDEVDSLCKRQSLLRIPRFIRINRLAPAADCLQPDSPHHCKDWWWRRGARIRISLIWYPPSRPRRRRRRRRPGGSRRPSPRRSAWAAAAPGSARARPAPAGPPARVTAGPRASDRRARAPPRPRIGLRGPLGPAGTARAVTARTRLGRDAITAGRSRQP